jgi:hypothetical protein
MALNWFSSLTGGQLMLLALNLVLLGIVWSVFYSGGKAPEEPGFPEGEGRLYEKLPRNSIPPEIEPVPDPGGINVFTKVPPALKPAEPGLKLFGRGELQSVRNIIKDTSAMPGALYFNYDYTVVMQGGARNYPFTVGFYKVKGLGLPEFELSSEGPLDRVGNMFSRKDIDPELDPVFSKRYRLTGPDKAAVASLFSSDVMETFNRLRGRWYAQGVRDCVIVFKDGFLSAKDYTRFMEGAAAVFRAVANRG